MYVVAQANAAADHRQRDQAPHESHSIILAPGSAEVGNGRDARAAFGVVDQAASRAESDDR